MQALIRGEKARCSGVICHLCLKERRDKIGSVNYMILFLYYLCNLTMGIFENRNQTSFTFVPSPTPSAWY